MKTIELADHELSVIDYSNFEVNLLLKGGRITATVKTCSTNGMKRYRLVNPVVTFDETISAEGRIEGLLKSFRFQHKAPIERHRGTMIKAIGPPGPERIRVNGLDGRQSGWSGKPGGGSR